MIFITPRNIMACFICLMLTACAGDIDRTKEGSVSNFSERQIKEKIVVGQSTKRDVLMLLGRPTTPLDYNGSNNWIYFSDVKDRRIYFLIPLFLDEKVMLGLKFNDSNIVEEMEYSRK